MARLKALRQLLLPGVNKVTGAERVPGKPGLYHVEPSKANLDLRAALKRAERRAMEEGDLAERPNGGPISMKGRENARGAHMLSGALNELRYASDAGGSIARPVKGLVYVDKSGNPRAAAAINKEKAGEYLSDDFDLDFTKVSPNYLEYVSTTTPDVRGSDLLRLLQELHGDDMVFQVANPKKNVPIYEAMGAKRMAPRIDGGDALGGHAGLPAFRIEKRIPERRAQSADPRQLRLPGFKKGGAAWSRPLSDGRGGRDTSRSVFDDQDTVYPPTVGEMGETLLTEAAFNALPLGALAKLGKRLAKGAARSAPVAVPAVAAASSEDAEAASLFGVLSRLGQNWRPTVQRLFAEAPGTQAFTDDAVARALQAGYRIKPMTAREFQGVTYPFDWADATELKPKLKELRAAARAQELENLPALLIGQEGRIGKMVSGHDGRHRLQAIGGVMGRGTKSPVLVVPKKSRIQQGEYGAQQALDAADREAMTLQDYFDFDWDQYPMLDIKTKELIGGVPRSVQSRNFPPRFGVDYRQGGLASLKGARRG